MDLFRQELKLEELTSDILKTFYAYWLEKRGDIIYPRMRDINLDDLPHIKPYAAIATLQYPPFRMFYRFLGDKLVHFYGRNYTDRWLDELLIGEMLDDFEIPHRMAVTSDEPLLARSKWHGCDETYEWGIFPISENGVRVTGDIVIEDYSHLDKNKLPQRAHRLFQIPIT